MDTCDFFSGDTMYTGLKPLSTSTARSAHDSCLNASGSSLRVARSRMWPMDDSTT